MWQIFSRNVVETQQHFCTNYFMLAPWRLALYTNLLVKLIPEAVFLVMCDPSMNKL
jgi:hypothetical protein